MTDYKPRARGKGALLPVLAIHMAIAMPQMTHAEQYLKQSNAAISGHNIEKARSVHGCKARCDELNWCKSFDFDRRNNTCDISDKNASDAGGLKRNYPGNPYDYYEKDLSKKVRLSKASGSVRDVIEGLRYDSRRLLLSRQSGSQEVLPSETTSGSKVIVCKAKVHEGLSSNIDKVTVFSPTSGVFPGVAIWGDKTLSEGTLSELGLPMADQRHTLSLNANRGISETVTNPNIDTAKAAENRLLEQFFKSGTKATPANYKFKYEEVESSAEISAKLGFKAEWAENSGSMSASMKYDSQSSTVFGLFTQVFYSISVNIPDRSKFFADSVDGARLASLIARRDAPPAYVNKVDYGRLILVKMTTRGVHTEADVKAAFKYVDPGNDLTASGKLKASAKTALDSATFDLFVHGGTADDGLVKNVDIKRLRQALNKVISNNLKFDQNSAAVPIAYYTKFLDSNNLAKVSLTTDYVEHQCTEFPEQRIVVKHKGAYVAKVKVTYRLNGRWKTAFNTGSWGVGQRKSVIIPPRADRIKLWADAVWGSEIANRTVNANKCYVLTGTTLSNSADERGLNAC
ncbi:MAG: thiol-activated cytolysin family protein [Pseudomonadota bacterium]